jgi:tetratricopeptide (TPR) repeat protein
MSYEEESEVTKLRRAVVLDPGNANLRYLLGAEMAQAKDYEGAVLELSAAIALNPALDMARFQLGLLQLTLGQVEQMKLVLAPFENADDAAPLKHFKRGLEALAIDDFATCLTSLRRGIELNRQNEALNHDMSLIVSKVAAIMAEAPPQQSSGDPPAKTVRTDFSLYGDATRH